MRVLVGSSRIQRISETLQGCNRSQEDSRGPQEHFEGSRGFHGIPVALRSAPGALGQFQGVSTRRSQGRFKEISEYTLRSQGRA